jgi:hypothetical protein
MFNKLGKIIILTVSLCFFCSCQNFVLLSYDEWKEKTGNNKNEVDIYIVGYSQSTNNYPCYWKNGNRVDMKVTNPTGTSDFAIFVDENNDVYCGGNDQNVTERACYWKNGDIHPVNSTSGKNSKIKSIAVLNGVIYSAGVDNGKPCFWINDKQYFLSYPSGSSGEANSIVVDNENLDFYICGSYNSTYTRVCYWKNGADCITLDFSANHSYSYGINYSLGRVYVAGTYSGSKYACYWVDGIKVELSSTSGSYANSISIYNGDVYISGYIGSYTACWKNNSDSLWQETTANTKSVGNFIFNNDVYLAGKYGSTSAACYWKNGVQNTLSALSGATSSEARGIFVKAKK